MLKRKISSSILTFVLSVLILTLFFPISLLFSEMENQIDLKGDLLTYSVFIGLGILLYGLPISIFIEKTANKLKEGRIAFSFVLHILFGVLPFFILWFFTLFSLLISIMFFAIDELMRFLQKRISNDIYSP